MSWLNEANASTEDVCVLYLCGDRDQPCDDKDSCGAKACGERYCIWNY